MIRTQPNNLDTYLNQTRNDIVKLNDHVQTLIDTLTARGGNDSSPAYKRF